ncbi:hypothetical protein ElyMa_005389800 [Elysia marginata]|uniref:Uncharacterized protein n=1 Tax=Elysia marginata TaxID=1093978 RepID=A0AAV4EG36_9GAST|nr:hypothetical protein ElyMa_005389800 [Elysia marginata]
MSGKIIITIITNGNVSINISSHTNREKKDKNCHWQYKIVEIVESEVAKVDHIENIFAKSILFHMLQERHCHCVNKAATFGDQVIIKR